METLKRFSLIFFVVIFVVALVPFDAFATDPVTLTALAGAVDAYGMAYGVGSVYDVTSSSGVNSSFSGLWDEFSQYQSNNGSNYDYSQFAVDFNDAPVIDAFSHSSGKFAAWHIDSESAEIFDQFWDWLLTGPAEMVRVDNQYFEFSSNQIGPDAVPILVVTAGGWSDCLINRVNVNPMTNAQKWAAATRICDTSNGNEYAYYQYDVGSFYEQYDVYGFFVGSTLYFVSYYRTGDIYWGYKNGSTYAYPDQTPMAANSLNSTYNVYTGTDSFSNPITQKYLLTFSSLNAALADFTGGELYSESIGVISENDDGIVTLPNPYSQDYTPTAIDIVTSVPWDDTYDDSDDDNGVPIPWTPSAVPGVIDDIADSISAEDYSLIADPNPDPDPDPDPSPLEFFLPFIPVGIPSFNFNLSGIWHYVREWVTSLGAWLSAMFAVWAILPWAIVVPVYASLVVVIVLGVYRRFFM